MLNRLFEFSLGNRFLVLIFAGLIMAAGIYSMGRLPIDAVPDVTPNQVQIITVASGLGPVEVEQFITFPVETSMSGLPGIERIRSVSRFGLSLVTVYFREGMDIYFCRRLVMERLPAAKELIPAGFGSPDLGPISTGLGEIYQFQVAGAGYSLMQLRSILDWDISFKLKTVPGVVEVNAYGGELKTYSLELNASKLVAYGLPIARVYEAMEQNNSNAGGGYIEHAGEQYVIPIEGMVKNLGDIRNIVVAARGDGTPIRINDLGEVKLAPMIRRGAVTRDGRGEVVTGVVMMLIGENSRIVAQRVKTKLDEIQKTLPPGVTVDTYYDRTELVRKTIKTVAKNLTEGAILVIAVLMLMLGNLRGGLIVASAIPLSMLMAFTAMVYAGVSGNLMSLGAIDFGLIVDGSVVMIENIIRHISERSRKPGVNPSMTDDEIKAVVNDAGREVMRPIFFAVLIIIMVYLPILSLEGVEGKMFRPMALTVIFALTGSLLLSLTLMPSLATFFLRTGVSEKETWLVRRAHEIYLPLLEHAMARPGLTSLIAAGIFLIGLMITPFLGAEFVPRLDEGTLAIQAWRLPSVSLEEAIRSATLIEKVLKRFPEVKTVVSRTGSAEIPTDPMGPDTSDIYVILKPNSEWTTATSMSGLVEAIDAALRSDAPGTVFSYSQPIELRVQELIAGVRSDVAISIFGPDLDALAKLGDDVVRSVSQVQGAADVKAERVTGLANFRIIIDRQAIARYGINASTILDTAKAIGGREVGQVLEGEKRFPMQVRLEADERNVEAISELRVADGKGRMIPLKDLATLRLDEGPAQISRENLHRRLAVEVNVRGRDLAGFVTAAQSAVTRDLKLPAGYWIEWGGQFENLRSATSRLMIVVPTALFLIFILLYSTFNAVKPGLLIYLNVPLAATGGIFALALRGMPFSISAAIGFIAVSGIAVLNGVVLMSYILQTERDGLPAAEAARQGGEIRLRPVLMTALVAGLGFLPMALSSSAGAEVQRPLATVVIGGLLTSTPLTLLVLPSLFARLGRDVGVGA